MKNSLLIALIAASIWGCNKVLPRPTESGRNIAGFKVNGIVCIPEKQIFTALSSKNFYGSFSQDSTFNLTINCKKFGLRLSSPRGVKEGSFDLLNMVLLTSYYPTEKYYLVKSKKVGNLIVSQFDFKNKIISGTFEFEAVNKNDPTDIVKITKGRFDVDFTTLK
jgi:hypothetical protein